MAYTAVALTTNFLQKAVFQASHGFVIGDILAFDGTNYYKTQANAEPFNIGMVSFVTSVDVFSITQVGYISGLAYSVTPGLQYWLSTTVPGRLQTTAPASAGEYIAALFIADGVNSGYYCNTQAILYNPADGFIWTPQSTDITMTVNRGYIVEGTGTRILTLPPVAPQGSLISIVGKIAGGFEIHQGSGQTIHAGAFDTTTGVSGSLASTQRRDVVHLICDTANTDFTWIGEIGNITVV